MSTREPRREALDSAYAAYNRRCEASRDPVHFLHSYGTQSEIELAALVASSLAYGRVAQIKKSVSRVLEALGNPGTCRASFKDLTPMFAGFRHRFTSGIEIASLISAYNRIAREYGSLGDCFRSFYRKTDETVLPALCGFVNRLYDFAPAPIPSLIPRPEKGSALKRLNLFLRWMIRKDEIDPGAWKGISPSKLIVPLDTHMHRIGCAFGFTRRKQADMKTALEITRGFRAICPEDPVKYDFSLTHSSISGKLPAF